MPPPQALIEAEPQELAHSRCAMYPSGLQSNKTLLFLIFFQSSLIAIRHCGYLAVIITARASPATTLVSNRLRSAQNKGKVKDQVNVFKLFFL